MEERRSAEEKIQLLREEIDLIDSHLVEQRTKIAEVEEMESSSRSNVALLEKSVADLEDEMEKLEILASQGTSGAGGGARR
jgi:chromosome segregation ATPase